MRPARKTPGRRPGPGFISAILLAAGLSSRFGGTKQLAEIGGVALVRRSLAALGSSDVDEVVVVVGHRAAEVAREAEGTGARVVVNEDYRSGLGSSLRKGVLALSAESSAVVICLADQPFVSEKLVGRILTRYRRTGADVVASASGSLTTPPVLFSRSLYGELANLSGDRGAKAVIESHPGYEKVSVGRGVLLDVDTERDIREARVLLSKGRVTERKRTPGESGP